jgi:hypothetical protein
MMSNIFVKFLKLFNCVIHDFLGFFSVSPFLKPYPFVRLQPLINFKKS